MLPFSAFLLALLASLLACGVSGNVLVVPTNYSTLHDATIAASNGDTIQIVSDLFGCGATAEGAVIVDKSVSIVGVGGPIVDCMYQGRAITATGINTAISLTIVGIHFARGFSNNTSGGVVLISGNVQIVLISNCSFSDNIVVAAVSPSPADGDSGDADASLDGSFDGSVTSPIALVSGGSAVMIFVSTAVAADVRLTVANTTFSKNISPAGNIFSGATGGALGIWFNGSLVTGVSVDVVGGNFWNNVGSAVFLGFNGDVFNSSLGIGNDHCSFVNNSAVSSGGYGGAINQQFNGVVRSSALSLGQNSSFVNCSVDHLGGGGAIAVSFNGAVFNTSLVIGQGPDTRFLSNIASDGYGGACNVIFSAQATGIFVSVGEEALFVGNIAPAGNAGAILVAFLAAVSDGFTELGLGAKFIQNYASQAGAISLVFEGQVNLARINVAENATLASNVALGTSGAGGINVVFQALTYASTITVGRGSTFLNNLAVSGGFGGAMFVEFMATVTGMAFHLGENAGFATNRAFYSGGAIFFLGTADLVESSVSLGTSSAFLNNSVNSGGYGGAVIASFQAAVISSTVSTGNGHAAFAENSAELGGAVVLQARGATSNAVFVVGGGSSSFLRNGLFSTLAGLSPKGGALFISTSAGDNTSIVISDSTFVSNIGGAAFVQVVSLPGVPVSTTWPTIISCTNSVFTGNIGGGLQIFAPPDILRTANCSVCSSALVLPPDCGFPASSDNLCSISNNQVQNLFLPLRFVTNVHLANLTFENNSGAVQGGGLFVANGLIRLSNMTFINCSASQNGGALNIAGTAQVLITDGFVIQNNTAASDTAVTFSMQGSLIVGGSVTIWAVPPPLISNLPGAEQRVYSAVSLRGTGNFGILGLLQLSCASGYNYLGPASLGVAVAYVSGWINPMKITNFEAGCSPCPSGTYSLASGGVSMTNATAANGGTAQTIQCLECPAGGNCSFGVDKVLAVREFWGTIAGGASKADDPSTGRPEEWKFFSCPIGYCCNSSHGCNAESQCAFGRDPSVPLCGECLPGYSQALVTTTCMETDACNDGKWFWPVMGVVVLVWVGFLLYTSKPVRAARAEKIDLTWVVPTLFFFFQNVSLIFIASGISLPSPIASTILIAVTNLHLSGGGGGSGTNTSSSDTSWWRVCAVRGLTTIQSIGLRLILPCAVAVFTAFSFLVWRFFFSYTKKTAKTMAARFASASVKLILLFYTSIASVVGTLLHCVPVDVPSTIDQSKYRSVVFRAGVVECYQSWQIGLFFVFAAILFAPILLALLQTTWRRTVARTEQTEAIQSSTTTITSRSSNNNSLSMVVVNSVDFSATEAPFRLHRWYWAPLTLARRLLVSIVFSFVEDASVQSVLFTLLFVVYLCVQVGMSPFSSRSGNIVETVGLFSLAVISLCAVRTGTLAEAAASVLSGSTAGLVSAGLEVLQSVLFFLPVVTAAVLVGFEWCWYRWWRNGVSRRNKALLMVGEVDNGSNDEDQNNLVLKVARWLVRGGTRLAATEVYRSHPNSGRGGLEMATLEASNAAAGGGGGDVATSSSTTQNHELVAAREERDAERRMKEEAMRDAELQRRRLEEMERVYEEKIRAIMQERMGGCDGGKE